MSRLVTPSLFSAIRWAREAPSSWRERAWQALRDTLARVWGELGDAARRGIDFENWVRRFANRDPATLQCSDLFRKVLDECRGGQQQRKIKRYVEIAGERYCLYGKVDFWFPQIIKDLKTTGEFGGAEKYLKSVQHELYCWIENIPFFRYVVAEFEGDDARALRDVHLVDWRCESMDALWTRLESKILDALAFLQGDEELWSLYLTKYSQLLRRFR